MHRLQLHLSLDHDVAASVLHRQNCPTNCTVGLAISIAIYPRSLVSRLRPAANIASLFGGFSRNTGRRPPMTSGHPARNGSPPSFVKRLSPSRTLAQEARNCAACVARRWIISSDRYHAYRISLSGREYAFNDVETGHWPPLIDERRPSAHCYHVNASGQVAAQADNLTSWAIITSGRSSARADIGACSTSVSNVADC